MPFLLSTLKIEQNIFEDLFLHLQQLRSSSKGAERSKHLHNTFIIVLHYYCRPKQKVSQTGIEPVTDGFQFYATVHRSTN